MHLISSVLEGECVAQEFALTVHCVADLCAIDQQLCQDENSLLSFEAICSIHKLMDDDADGTVDTTETDGVRHFWPTLSTLHHVFS